MHCPICNSQFEQHETEAMPFCSERCRLLDIGRWLEEGYSLPRIADPEDDEVPDDDTLRN